MVEFSVTISDSKGNKSYKTQISGHHANLLIGKKIDEEIDGIFVGLPGYKLAMTGGSDKSGTPMRKEIAGQAKRHLLLSGGIGFHPARKGMRKRKLVRGNAISDEIVQINMKIVSWGAKPIEEALKKTEEKK
jgi:small subunit ribosomal protein S6e